MVSGFTECFYNFQTLNNAGTFLSAGILQFIFQCFGLFFQINSLQKFLNGFCTHTNTERITKIFSCFLVFLLGKNLFYLNFRCLRFQYNIGSKIQYFFQYFWRNIQNQAHAARNSLEVPNMGYRSSQLNVTHAFTTNAGFCDFHTTSVADNTFITYFFVLTAMTFPVFARSKNTLAIQTVFFRFQGTIIDGLRLLYLTSGPLTDFFRRCQSDFNFIVSQCLFFFITILWHIYNPSFLSICADAAIVINALYIRFTETGIFKGFFFEFKVFVID